MSDDIRYMGRALALAEPGLGKVWPNPSVGCLLVKDGVVVGEARTANGGRPHAEPLAIALAGDAARGATAYVSLEPCSHVGETSPCTEALIAAGVKRVLVAVCDPDPRVNGRGIAQLRNASVEVEVGLLAAKAAQLNGGFFRRIQTGQPVVHALDVSAASAPHRSYDAHMIALEDIGSDAIHSHLTADRTSLRIVVAQEVDQAAAERLRSWAAQNTTWLLGPKTQSQQIPECAEFIAFDQDPSEPLERETVISALGARGLTRVLTGGRLSAWATEEL